MPHTRQTALDELARLRAQFTDATEPFVVDVEIVDALIATPDPRDVDGLRDELISQMCDETRKRAAAVSSDDPRRAYQHTNEIFGLSHAIGVLPMALEAIPEPAPAINVERLAADVWNATQEAGYPTMYGDAAVAAIRHVLEGAALVPYRLGAPG